MKKTLKTLLLMMSIIVFILVVNKVDSCAAEVTSSEGSFIAERINVFGTNGKYFDHVAYADTYPDLYEAFGYNKSALWKHYVTNGVYENRVAYGTTMGVTSKLTALNAVASVTNNNMSDRDKAVAIHDWIVNNTRYDYENYIAGTIPRESYTKEGVFLYHTAVCAGYADAYSYMARLAGIRCDFIGGTATNDAGTTGGHAWNRVMIDGTWMYVDCTWDDPVSLDGSNVLRYDYLLIPEETMNRNHVMTTIKQLY